MVLHQAGDKPLIEPMMIMFSEAYMYSQAQWFKNIIQHVVYGLAISYFILSFLSNYY